MLVYNLLRLVSDALCYFLHSVQTGSPLSHVWAAKSESMSEVIKREKSGEVAPFASLLP